MEFADLLIAIFKQYGAPGLAIVGGLYYIKALDSKIDRLTNLTYKTFGVMLSLVDDKFRRDLIDKGDD